MVKSKRHCSDENPTDHNKNPTQNRETKAASNFRNDKKRKHDTEDAESSEDSDSSSSSSSSASSSTTSSSSTSSSQDISPAKKPKTLSVQKNASDKVNKKDKENSSSGRQRPDSGVERQKRDNDDNRKRSRDEKDVSRLSSKWDSPREHSRRRSRSLSQSRNARREKSREKESRQSRDHRAMRRDVKEKVEDRDRRDQDRDRTRQETNRHGRNDGNRDRDNDQHDRRNRRSRSKSRSPRRDYRRSERDERGRGHMKREKYDKDESKYEWGKKSEKRKDDPKPEVEKEKPNFGLSGALTEDANKVNGVVVKYAEPPEARKPKRRWRLYPFKGETALPTLHIHRQSCFLIGRDRKVVDIAVDHPSCSKQHAALQYRLVPFEREDGTQGKRVRLYLIDLESANGTFLNNKKIEPRRYYELVEKDVIKFGFSTREYVLLHENSKDEEEDDDVKVKSELKDEPE